MANTPKQRFASVNPLGSSTMVRRNPRSRCTSLRIGQAAEHGDSSQRLLSDGHAHRRARGEENVHARSDPDDAPALALLDGFTFPTVRNNATGDQPGDLTDEHAR